MESKNPRPRAKERACDRAIKRTLAYRAVFNYPLSQYQLYQFLITKKEFDFNFYKKSLRRLLKKRHIRVKDERYYFAGIRPVSWALRDKYTQDLIQETRTLCSFLKNIRWIKLLAITGSVAANNAKKDDDIDIFIVSARNRMWLTRGFVILVLKIANKYAQKDINQRKLCCNLFIDETRMKWEREKQSVYTAHEVVGMQPLIDRDNTYLKFLRENEWALKYFYNYKVDTETKIPHKGPKQSKMIDKLENLARKMQLRYMQNKKTSEITTKNFIHFKKHDHAEEILRQYKTLLETSE